MADVTKLSDDELAEAVDRIPLTIIDESHPVIAEWVNRRRAQRQPLAEAVDCIPIKLIVESPPPGAKDGWVERAHAQRELIQISQKELSKTGVYVTLAEARRIVLQAFEDTKGDKQPAPEELKKSISAIEWPNEAGTGYNVGEFDVTSIVPFSRGQEDWLEVREGEFVCCQVPAYQVAIFYKKPDKPAPATPQSEDE